MCRHCKETGEFMDISTSLYISRNPSLAAAVGREYSVVILLITRKYAPLRRFHASMLALAAIPVFPGERGRIMRVTLSNTFTWL
jgi:hypothetical protein